LKKETSGKNASDSFCCYLPRINRGGRERKKKREKKEEKKNVETVAKKNDRGDE
jgi:hypothetical protein